MKTAEITNKVSEAVNFFASNNQNLTNLQAKMVMQLINAYADLNNLTTDKIVKLNNKIKELSQ